MNSVQTIDLKYVSGGSYGQNILKYLFDSADSAEYIDLGKLQRRINVNRHKSID